MDQTQYQQRVAGEGPASFNVFAGGAQNGFTNVVSGPTMGMPLPQQKNTALLGATAGFIPNAPFSQMKGEPLPMYASGPARSNFNPSGAACVVNTNSASFLGGNVTPPPLPRGAVTTDDFLPPHHSISGSTTYSVQQPQLHFELQHAQLQLALQRQQAAQLGHSNGVVGGGGQRVSHRQPAPSYTDYHQEGNFAKMGMGPLNSANASSQTANEYRQQLEQQLILAKLQELQLQQQQLERQILQNRQQRQHTSHAVVPIHAQQQQIYQQRQPAAMAAGLPVAPSHNSTATAATANHRPPIDVKLWGYAVCDPHHPFLQRVPVPPSACSPTKGMLCYNNDVQSSSTKPCASTICIGWGSAPSLDGTPSPVSSCPFGEACPHFHVDREYLAKARSVLEPLCCAYHNDYFSREIVQANTNPSLVSHRYALLLEDKSGIEISPAYLAFTTGLDSLPSKGKGTAACKYISVRKHLCRLHLEGKCKWTKDCSHVHVCREVYRQIMNTPRQALLNTLSSPDLSTIAIVQRISATPAFLSYIRSPTCLPLISWVLEGVIRNKADVMRALSMAGGLFSEEQAALAAQLYSIDVPLSQIAPVPTMLRRFFKPPAQAYAAALSANANNNGDAPLNMLASAQSTPEADVCRDPLNGQYYSQSSQGFSSNPPSASPTSSGPGSTPVSVTTNPSLAIRHQGDVPQLPPSTLASDEQEAGISQQEAIWISSAFADLL